MRDDRERLRDMLEAVDRIQGETGRGRAVFEGSELVRVWVIHHLQILGEAAMRVSEPLRLTHPEVPWAKIIGMRHILVHGYFQTDLDIVWQAVEQDLPALKAQLTAMLASFDR